jgi:hypothetical protein
MNMHVELLQFDRIDAELGGARLDQRHRGLRALLHHIAQLAGEYQPAPAGNAGPLDEQNIAARGCPGETRCNAGHAGAHCDFCSKRRGPRIP